MKSVALVGMGPSWETALEADTDEIWTINYFYEMAGLMKPDRVFDVHDLHWYRDSQEVVKKHKTHWEYLTKEKPFKFYAPLEYPEVPGITVYPMGETIKMLKNFRRTNEDGGSDIIKFITSSFDLMMAVAIDELEAGDRIELYGWQMGWNLGSNVTEYLYQLPGLGFWTGYALGKGIEVIVDKKTSIFKTKLYTYDGDNQVITRQTLETFKRGWELKLQEHQADFHTAQGTYKTFEELLKEDPKNELYQNSLQEKLFGVNNAFKVLMHAEGCLGMIMHLLDEVDTAETNVDIQSALIGIIDKATAEAVVEAVSKPVKE